MNICIEHSAHSLAGIIGKVACDGIILPYGRAPEVIATTMRGNPFEDQWLLDADLPGHSTVAWTGTLATGLFQADPRTWMRPGHQAFRSFCADIRPQLERHHRHLLFQPHSRHVLNDVQSSLNFIREHQNSPFKLALAPASLLEPNMLRDLEDHLFRMFSVLGPECSMLLVADIAVDAGNPDDLQCGPLGSGLLPRSLMRSLIHDHIPAETPIVIMAETLAKQMAWLND